jgi:hypothetical protein
MLRIAAAIILTLGSGHALGASPVTVTLEYANHDHLRSQPVTLEVRAMDSESSARHVVLKRSSQCPGTVNIDLDANQSWRLDALAQGYWSAPITITPGLRGSSPITIRLFDGSSVRGSFNAPKGLALPREFALRVSQIDWDSEANTVTCPIADSSFECLLPSGELDLRFRLMTAAPVYFWGVHAVAGKTLDLGAIPLRRGGTVTGRVELSERGRLETDCRVVIRPETAENLRSKSGVTRLRQMERTTRAGARGFFQFSGLEPGRYTLVATLDGFSSTVLAPFEVKDGLGTELPERIVIRRPTTVGVRVSPPLSPAGGPWHIQLARKYNGGEPLIQGALREGMVDATGGWRGSDVVPGNYDIIVLDDAGASWARQEIDVGSQETDTLIQVSLVAVEGTVQVGNTPVKGVLLFGGRSGPRRIQMSAEDDGRFMGFLPDEGTWPLDFADSEGLFTLDPVAVKLAPGEGIVRLSLNIPDTLLEGDVVDEKDQPATGAEVRIYDGPHFATVLAGEDGSFRKRGIYPGKITVEARSGDRASDQVQLVLNEGPSRPPSVHLKLRSRKEIKGIVVGPSGGVPGARVVVLPSSGGELVNSAAGPDGAFTLSLPSDVEGGSLVAFSPGLALRMMTVELESDRTLTVPLDSEFGTLNIELQGPFGAPGQQSPAIVYGTLKLPLPILFVALGPRYFVPDNRGSLRLPFMPVGNYTICSSMSASKCSVGFLGPGLELTVPLGQE